MNFVYAPDAYGTGRLLISPDSVEAVMELSGVDQSPIQVLTRSGRTYSLGMTLPAFLQALMQAVAAEG